jgi:hypothetical protein
VQIQNQNITEELNDKFYCKMCDKKYTRGNDLSRHIKLLHNIKDIEYYDLYIKMKDEDICKQCGKKNKFMCLSMGYRKTCNDEKCVIKLKKLTKLNLYGDENYNNNKKAQNTCLKKYGTKTPIENQAIKEKTIKTTLKKYGTTNNFNTENRKNTMMKKYGVENPFSSEIIKQKMIENSLLKYGTKFPSQSEEVKKKIRETSFKNYGVENPMQNEEHKNKVFSSFKKKKYTTKNYSINDKIIYYQTKPELEFIEYCVKNNIEIKNGPSLIYYLNNKKHYYFVDFEIKINNKSRLIEIKRKHCWWYKELKNGKILNKTISAQKYSKENDYLPYKILFNNIWKLV